MLLGSGLAGKILVGGVLSLGYTLLAQLPLPPLVWPL